MNMITYSYLNRENHIYKAVELFHKICSEPGGELIYRVSDEELLQMLQTSDSLGAWDGQRLAGLGVLILGAEMNKSHRDLLNSDENISTAELGYFVDYDYRRKGIAKALVCELINRAREININTITASTRKENTPSAKILIAQGFVLTAEYDRGDGHWRNLYRKDL